MEINKSELKRIVLFEVVGKVDNLGSADELGRVLDVAVDEGKNNIVLDLSKVEYMSSAGLREMVRVLKRVKRSGGDLRIADPSPRVKEFLELARLSDGVFKIYFKLEDAVGSF